MMEMLNLEMFNTDTLLAIVFGIFGIMIIWKILKTIWKIAMGFIKTIAIIGPVALTVMLFMDNIWYGIITAIVSILWYFIIYKIKDFFEGIHYRRMQRKYSAI